MAEQSGLPAPVLLERFGVSLFSRLARGFPAFLVGIESTFDLVARYETHIADELRSLHPDAQPPELTVVRRQGRVVDLVYRSPAGLADLAFGLLLGSVEWFEDALDVCRDSQGPSETRAVFQLRPRPPDDVASEDALRPPPAAPR